jgi:hypothetical protein
MTATPGSGTEGKESKFDRNTHDAQPKRSRSLGQASQGTLAGRSCRTGAHVTAGVFGR